MLNQFLQLGECVREISKDDPLKILKLVKNRTVNNYPVVALEINLDNFELSLKYIPVNSDNKETQQIHKNLTNYMLDYALGRNGISRVDNFLTIVKDFKIKGKHIDENISIKDLEVYDKRIKTKIANFFKKDVIHITSVEKEAEYKKKGGEIFNYCSKGFKYLIEVFPEGIEDLFVNIAGLSKNTNQLENQSLFTSELFKLISNDLVKRNTDKEVSFIHNLSYYFVKDGKRIYPFNMPEIINMLTDFISKSPINIGVEPYKEGTCTICGSNKPVYDRFPNTPFNIYASTCRSTANLNEDDFSSVFLACEDCAKTIKYGQMIIRFNPNFHADFKLDEGNSYHTYVFPSSYKVNKKLKDRIKTIATGQEGKKELLTKADLKDSDMIRQNILTIFESSAMHKIVSRLQDIPCGKFSKIKSSMKGFTDNNENNIIQGLGSKIIGYANQLCKVNKDNLFVTNFFIKVQKAVYFNEKLTLKDLGKYIKDIPIDEDAQRIYISQLYSFIKFMKEMGILEFEDMVEFKELGKYVEGLSKVANHTKGIWSHFPYRNSSKQKLSVWIQRVYESLENLSSSINKQLPNLTSEGINKITNSLLKANDSEMNIITLNILFGRSLAEKMNGGTK